MAVHISAHEVADARRQISVHDQPYILTDYIGAAPRRGQYVAGSERNDNGLPQGFLVDQPAGAVTQPHFHSHPQFQLVVDGSGRLGKHDVGFLDLHYVNGHTPYGPVAAGDDGLLYFTLRRYWDAGAKYMPASRDLLVKGRQRTRYGGVPATATRKLAEAGPANHITVIAPEADGLGAWLVQAGPGESFSGPVPATGDGQYHVVVRGTVIHDATELETLSCGFVEAADPAPVYRAGVDGAALMICQFPCLEDAAA